MIEQEWMKFASTGSIQDYLSYRCRQGTEGVYGDASSSMLAGTDTTGRSVNGYGTDHSADGHGVISSPGGGI
ncbi:hypothetical protein AALA98_01800 [Lachnospiraceae bacterium 45-W7]